MVKRERQPSFEMMVRYFLRNYDIPTSRDFNKIMTRLDRLEKAIKTLEGNGKGRRPYHPQGRSRIGMTITATVLDVIGEFKKGCRFDDIRDRTGFDDKTIRNVIFRLDKSGQIKRIHRGVYVKK